MSGAFISYVHEDSQIVDKIARILRNNSVDVWLDRKQLYPGIRWKQGIALAIQSGTFFISVHSSARERRDRSYVNEELTIAIEEVRKRPTTKPWLIPVKLDNSEIEPRSIGGGETLLDLQYCDLRDWNQGITNLLFALGVEKPSLSTTTQRRREKIFCAPKGSPHAAMNALNNFQENYGASKFPKNVAAQKTSAGTLRDLLALGQIQADNRDGSFRLVNPHGDQSFALKSAISNTPSFKIGIAKLQADINSSASAIGEAVAAGLGRTWSEASIMRNGHAIRKWIFVLYPNLKPPKIGEPAYLRQKSFEKGDPSKGAHSFVSREVLEEIAEHHPDKKTPSQVSKHLGCATETVRRWRRKNADIWMEIFEIKNS